MPPAPLPSARRRAGRRVSTRCRPSERSVEESTSRGTCHRGRQLTERGTRSQSATHVDASTRASRAAPPACAVQRPRSRRRKPRAASTVRQQPSAHAHAPTGGQGGMAQRGQPVGLTQRSRCARWHKATLVGARARAQPRTATPAAYTYIWHGSARHASGWLPHGPRAAAHRTHTCYHTARAAARAIAGRARGSWLHSQGLWSTRTRLVAHPLRALGPLARGSLPIPSHQPIRGV